MPHYDPVTIFTVTADSHGSSNKITGSTNVTSILVHKVVLRNSSNGSNVVTVQLNDHLTIGSSATLIALSTVNQGGAAGDLFQRYTSETFDPPVSFSKGLSIDVAGADVSASIFYTRQ
jgi:hypothetical protein